MEYTTKTLKVKEKIFLDEKGQKLEELNNKPIPKKPNIKEKEFLEDGNFSESKKLFGDISQITINSEETSNETFGFSLLEELKEKSNYQEESEEQSDHQEELEEKFKFLVNNYFGYEEGKLNKIRNLLKDHFSDEIISKLTIENYEKLHSFTKKISEEFNSIVNYIQENTQDEHTGLDCDYARGDLGEFELMCKTIDKYKNSEGFKDDSYEIILGPESFDPNIDFNKLMEKLNQIAGYSNNKAPGKNPKTSKTDQLEKKWLNKSQ